MSSLPRSSRFEEAGCAKIRAVSRRLLLFAATTGYQIRVFAEAARRLETAVARVYAAGEHLTVDQGGTATTTAFCEAVARQL